MDNKRFEIINENRLAVYVGDVYQDVTYEIKDLIIKYLDSQFTLITVDELRALSVEIQKVLEEYDGRKH